MSCVGDRPHCLLLVLLRVCDTRHQVSAGMDNDVADLLYQFLLTACLRERLTAGTQSMERTTEPAELFVEGALPGLGKVRRRGSDQRGG